MKANTPHKDLTGTAAADIANITTRQQHNDLNELAGSFKLDKERFDLIGLSIYGTKEFSISFLCVDKKKSTEKKEHIVSMRLDEDYDNILSRLFKTLHIVLHEKFDNKYPEMQYDEEVRFSDFKHE